MQNEAFYYLLSKNEVLANFDLKIHISSVMTRLLQSAGKKCNQQLVFSVHENKRKMQLS